MNSSRWLGWLGRLALMAAFLSISGAAAGDEASGAKPWSMPEVSLGKAAKHPVIACTATELERLKAAWKSTGAAKEVLRRRFAEADAAIKAAVTFPPEGGQHNQWYQCDKCQMALQTVDARHHKCPKCAAVYSGFPYDNVLYGRTHSRNLRSMEDAAWAWAVTGEKRYAEFAAGVLLGYAERYLEYPMLSASVGKKDVDVSALDKSDWRYRSAGHIWEQTLNESMGMIPVATAYDLICDSGAMTADQKRLVETKLIRAMAANIDKNTMGKSNWQTWHNAALLWAGAVLGDEAMVRLALTDPQNGFAFQMTVSVSAEGLWYENSWGYHYYTLTAMTHIAEGARRLGIDLYGHPLMRKMYTLAFDYQMSDSSLPRFGDAVQDSVNRPSVNEEAAAVYGDERILSTLPFEPTWDSILLGRDLPIQPEPPELTSAVFPGAGHAILRTSGPGKLTAALTFGPYGGFHGHFDKLSFVFFGHGQELAVDPGRAQSQAYRLPIHGQWYKATTGHNAVLVDGTGQKEADGKLLAFAANDAYAAVTADAGPAFDSVSHRRFLLLAPAYLLVVDQLQATDDKEHTFDWLYHNTGARVTCDLPKADAALGDHPGYAYLKDVAAHAVGQERGVEVAFAGEKLTTHLKMLAVAGDQVFTATGPFRSVDDRVPMVVVRRKGRAAFFVSVIAPEVTAGGAAVPTLGGITGGRSLSLSVHCGTDEDRVSFLANDLAAFTVWRETSGVLLKAGEAK